MIGRWAASCRKMMYLSRFDRCDIHRMLAAVYSWRPKDPRTGRWRVLRWKMTKRDAEDHRRVYGAELERVEGSEDVRTDLIGRGVVCFPAHSTKAIVQYFDKKLAELAPERAKKT